MTKGVYKKYKNVFTQIMAILIGILIMIPIIYAFNISVSPTSSIMSIPPTFFPEKVTLEHYVYIFKHTKIIRFMFNSLFIASVISIMRLLTASLASFGFSFFDFKGKNLLFNLVIMTILMPGNILLVSNYQTVSKLGLIDTYLGIMIVFFINALNVFMLRQSFMTFPKELKEASVLDGLTNWKFFWKILMPLNIPVLTSVFITSFIQMWNEYIWPLLVTNHEKMRTVQLAVTTFAQSDTGTIYGPLMATAITSLIPVAIIFVIFRKQIIGGTMSGSVKG